MLAEMEHLSRHLPVTIRNMTMTNTFARRRGLTQLAQHYFSPHFGPTSGQPAQGRREVRGGAQGPSALAAVEEAPADAGSGID